MDTVFGLNKTQAQEIVTTVQKALKAEETHAINFNFRGISIAPGNYSQVSRALDNGMTAFEPGVTGPNDIKGLRVHVAKSNKIDDQARFNQKNNTIIFRSPMGPSGLQFFSIIVHECTHASLDLAKVRINQLDNEIAAYLAEAMFVVRIFSKRSSDPSDWETNALAIMQGQNDKIRPAAVRAAIAVQKVRSQYAYKDSYCFFGDDNSHIVRVGAAISADSAYANPASGNAMDASAVVDWGS